MQSRAPSALLRCVPRLRGPRLRCRAVAAAHGGDVVRRSISENGEVAVLVCIATDLVAGAAARHCTAPTATAALGRALVGGLLLASSKTEAEQVQLTFRGGGPLGKLSVIADSSYRVKGYVDNPACDPPLRPDGKLNVGAAVGPLGVLQVVRSSPSKNPYTGAVALSSGEIADDIATYLHSSEQIASALGLGVSIGRSLAVEAAGGWIVQCLPFASEETLSALEKSLASVPPITKLIRDGLDAAEITELLLQGIGVSPGAQEHVPSYGPCVESDLRMRMERSVAALGAQEIERIVQEQGKLEVTCEFCRTTLLLDPSLFIKTA